MKMLRSAVLALLVFSSPAFAQWQTPNHSIPIGRGGGTTGFGSVLPGNSGIPLIGQGSTSDPAYGQVVNGGVTPGAANTLKGSLDGANTSDIAVPACTGVGQAIRWTAGTGPSCGTVIATTGFDMPVNLGLTASASASALTLTVTQASGSAPTSGQPVAIPFRSSSLTSGAVTSASITSTVSLTIPNGATLGTSNGVPFRIWIFMDYNGGTPALGVATCSNATTIFPCTSWETTLKTSLTIGAGSGSAGVLYAAAGVSSDAVRIIGYCEYASGLTTAGAYLSACTTLQLMGPGTTKPGGVVQTVAPAFGTLTVVTFTTIAATNVTAMITPTSPVNFVKYYAAFPTRNTGNGENQMQMFRGSTAIGALMTTNSGAAGADNSVTFVGLDTPQSVSAQTYVIKGTALTGTGSVPAANTYSATEILEEIMGALPEPANDNINPGVFSRVA